MLEQNFRKILYNLTENSNNFKKIIKFLNIKKPIQVTGMTKVAKSLLFAILAELTGKQICILSSDISSALQYESDISKLTGKKVKFYPFQEISPYELINPDVNIVNSQYQILNDFQNGNLEVISIPAIALLNGLAEKEFIDDNKIVIKTNEEFELYNFPKKLVNLGYKRVNVVTDVGEFSLKGDIIDIYPINEKPCRIEFWGDIVENIRYFDIKNQRSIKRIDKIEIYPCFSVVIDEKNKEILKNEIIKQYEKQAKILENSNIDTLKITLENILSNLEISDYFEGIDYFSPLLGLKRQSILDYLPQNTLIIYDESLDVFQKIFVKDEKLKNEKNHANQEGLLIELPEFLHIEPQKLHKNLNRFVSLKADSFIDDLTDDLIDLSTEIPPKFLANLDKLTEYVEVQQKADYSVIIATNYPQRVEEYLKYAELNTDYLNNTDNFRKNILLTESIFSSGFILPDEKLIILTDKELYNKKSNRPTINKKLSQKEDIDYILSVNDLQEGDFIVHSKHGIGKFIGMTQQTIDEQTRDYLTLEYQNGDKLHIPAEQINLLSRFKGSSEAPPRLSKMGGADWAKIKTRVEKEVTQIAQNLLNLYARRARYDGYKFDEDTAWQIEMEESFPYTETPDQMQAIIDTKADMETLKPMDRLICGDVGFGKTEVAIRAIFKAVLSDKQAILLAPTTVLTQQHYETLTERFKPYPIKIELLSRFRTPKQQKEAITKIATGECDVVIGTHRILQKDVRFKNLGLLVIDEEHRFGVSCKEKLKEFRAEIDVLTMSATPIPRTLNMALSGIRDMSQISTPPINRTPVKTFVGQTSDSIIRTAIKHELDREGQVYVVHNRVQTIHKFASNIQNLLPNAKIAIGHGQMKERDLEKVMFDFTNRHYDILICTTIIESGIDNPNANTIIIDEADKFGLAQLYQLRGRVGRSETQAYSYLLYNKNKILNDDAKKRLNAIKDYAALGSGYQVALRDMEIRGVGSILGEKQHGHMISVGFDMYCSLLEDAVNSLKGYKEKKKEQTIIDINITAYLPDEWTGSKDQKIIEYKRLADVNSFRELELISQEWEDRFGKIPEPAQNLINIIKLRLQASKLEIQQIREGIDGIKLYTNYTQSDWLKIRNKIPPKIARRLSFVKNNTKDDKVISFLILNNYRLSNEQVLNILGDLFYYIK
ncbi:MAG: transcription-repair coupling factor [Candidatus Gastranaerophilales bacterium]|nr:transcription-repair coupling factor [Candidatus Gastranaerophilales bacterium]